MSDFPQPPSGDYNMPPGVSVNDIPGECDDDHHHMMNSSRIAQSLGLNRRHFNDPPTIREMLDKMEEHRTCNAPCLVAMLRMAVNALEEYDDAPSAREALKSIELGLWATSPEELWYEPRPPMTEKESRECVDLMNRETLE